MKNFKQYLIENNNIIPLNDSDVIPMILSKCQQWFREVCSYPVKTNEDLKQLINDDNYSLFRGKSISDIHIIEQSLENRLPKDIPLFFHYATVKAMKKLGFVAHRGNSLFCTNNFGFADEYTKILNPHIVFVMDGYDYTFSPKIRDYIFLISKPLRELKELFVNYEKILAFVDGDDRYSITEMLQLNIIDMTKGAYELADLFEINADSFQRKFQFQNNGIKDYIFKSDQTIEFMIRGKLILTQLFWLNNNL